MRQKYGGLGLTTQDLVAFLCFLISDLRDFRNLLTMVFNFSSGTFCQTSLLSRLRKEYLLPAPSSLDHSEWAL